MQQSFKINNKSKYLWIRNRTCALLTVTLLLLYDMFASFLDAVQFISRTILVELPNWLRRFVIEMRKWLLLAQTIYHYERGRIAYNQAAPRRFMSIPTGYVIARKSAAFDCLSTLCDTLLGDGKPVGRQLHQGSQHALCSTNATYALFCDSRQTFPIGRFGQSRNR